MIYTLQIEILCYCHTCSSDAQQRPHLQKVNQLTLTAMKVKNAMLLTNNVAESLEIPPIPSKDEVVKLLSLKKNQSPEHKTLDIPEQSEFDSKIDEPCIVIWDEHNGRKWFVAMCLWCADSTYLLLEHLEPKWYDQTKRCWQYPPKPDEQIMLLDQTLNWNVIDEILYSQIPPTT